MQLHEITDNTNYDDFAGQEFDFGVGKFRIEQRFNDKDTDFGILQMYQSWGLTGHDGLDLTKVGDDTIPCFVSGKVVFADWFYNLDWIEKGYFQGGGRIVLIHNSERQQIYAYFHLAEINCSINQQLNRGDVIGKQGGSGFSDNAFPSHLHFKILNCDSQLNIQNLDNGFFGGENPLSELIAEITGQSQSTQEFTIIQQTTNDDDMLKEKLIQI
jgi:murein DD-endopeptidase MepM/ murein hydrolase activator NlpD